MTKEERELLILIAEMVFSVYCGTQRELAKSREEFYEHTNPDKEQLGRLRAILADTQSAKQERQQTANHRRQAKKQGRAKKAVAPVYPDGR